MVTSSRGRHGVPATLYEVGADSNAAAVTALAPVPRAAATGAAGAAGAAGVVISGVLLPVGACASVAHVGGTDALLASRLTAGDDHALAEAFDRFGRAI